VASDIPCLQVSSSSSVFASFRSGTSKLKQGAGVTAHTKQPGSLFLPVIHGGLCDSGDTATKSTAPDYESAGAINGGVGKRLH
jgi:hypothetical protein